MAISAIQGYKEIAGEVAAIYVARKGTVMVVCLDNGDDYMFNTLAPSCSKNPARQYWCHSIDHKASFSGYFTYGVLPSEKQEYKAESICEITEHHMSKLNKRYEFEKGKK